MSYKQHQQVSSMNHQPSYFSQMTKKEQIIGILGVLALMIGAFPISVLIFFYIVYSVSERNKLKLQISNVIISHPKTNVNFIATQTSTHVNKVTEALKMMILDQGEPIQFDLVQGTIKKMGKLSIEPLITSRDINTEEHTNAGNEIFSKQTNDLPEREEENPVTVQQVQPVVNLVEIVKEFSCEQCGAKLPEIARYCNECGVRQVRN